MGSKEDPVGEATGVPRTKYLSYLLRLWQVTASQGGERDAEGATWWATVECVQGGEQVSFASLDELVAFLRQQTQLASHSTTGANSTAA